MKELAAQWSYSAVGALGLAAESFAPEDGGLNLDYAGLAWTWAGDNSAGEPVPNGQYRITLRVNGVSPQTKGVWLVRKGLSAGAVVLGPNPCDGKTLRVWLGAGLGVRPELRLFNLAGELAGRLDLPAGANSVVWDLRRPDGWALAPGIYLVEVVFKGAGTAGAVVKKLAVVK